MPPGNINNLVPNEDRTPEERRANARKAGQASGAARRRKADLRKAAQQILDGTYADRSGRELSGYEIIIKGMVANLSDPKGRNWAKAMDLLITLTGAGQTKEQVAKIKADTAYTKARTKQIEEGKGLVEIEDLQPLADLLNRAASGEIQEPEEGEDEEVPEEEEEEEDPEGDE